MYLVTASTQCCKFITHDGVAKWHNTGESYLTKDAQVQKASFMICFEITNFRRTFNALQNYKFQQNV